MAQGGGFGRRGVASQQDGDSPSASPPAGSGKRSPLLVAATVLCGVLAFVVGAWLGREVVQQAFAYRASATLDQQMADMEKLARAKYPDLHPAEAAAKYARETAPDMVNASKSERERMMKAAATFFGFYHVNTRSRVDYCAKSGV